MRDESLVRRVFVREWDEAGALFRRPEGGALSSQIATVKLLLTGEGPGDYLAPSAVRLSEWMKQAIAASTNRDTGFLTLTGESADPALIVDVMAAAAAATDRLLKERYVGSSEQTMGFYQRQLAKARAREHREALAKLIAQEDQKLMLASKGDYFVAEPLTTPSVSLHPTSPKSSLILALAVVLGGFLGAALVLIRKAARS
jgi:rubrerythrin